MTLHTTSPNTPLDQKPSQDAKDPEPSPNGPDGASVEIDRLLEQIDGSVRQPVSVVFASLIKLLQQVPLFENLQQERAVTETTAALDDFRNQANVLIDFMLATATIAATRDELLSETLDGISFALSHDVKRIFDSELKTLNWKAGEQLGKGKVAYVQGLLTNCLQQSIITLAQVFDPSLNGARLFDNNQARLMESLILCRDLTEMLQTVHACENDLSRQSPILQEQVDRFREQSMQFLMYKDWQEFETTSESLMASAPETCEPGSPLHSFKCYLETLLGQVKLRAVLVDVFCDLFPDGERGTNWSEAQNRLAFELFRAELSSTIERGFSQEVSKQPELV